MAGAARRTAHHLPVPRGSRRGRSADGAATGLARRQAGRGRDPAARLPARPARLRRADARRREGSPGRVASRAGHDGAAHRPAARCRTASPPTPRSVGEADARRGVRRHPRPWADSWPTRSSSASSGAAGPSDPGRTRIGHDRPRPCSTRGRIRSRTSRPSAATPLPTSPPGWSATARCPPDTPAASSSTRPDVDAAVDPPAVPAPGHRPAWPRWTLAGGCSRRRSAGSSGCATSTAAPPGARRRSGTPITSSPAKPEGRPASPTPKACAWPATRRNRRLAGARRTLATVRSRRSRRPGTAIEVRCPDHPARRRDRPLFDRRASAERTTTLRTGRAASRRAPGAGSVRRLIVRTRGRPAYTHSDSVIVTSAKPNSRSSTGAYTSRQPRMRSGRSARSGCR